MKKIYTLIFTLILVLAKAQVGINTPSPLANLEVHRSNLPNIPDGIIPPRISADSLQLKDHLYGPAQDGALIYITKPVTRTSSKTQHVLSSGYYVYDSGYSNKDNSKGTWKKMFSDPNAFAARSISGVSFSKSTLASSDFQAIRFDSGFESEIGSEYIVDNQYVVPETGLYVVNYYVNIDNPNQKKIFKRPGLAIVKTTANASSRAVIASRLFNGDDSAKEKIITSLSPQAVINHIYSLKKGEKLSFGLIADNEVLSALGHVSSEISIYKIR